MGMYLGIDPLSTCLCMLLFNTVNGSKGSTLLENLCIFLHSPTFFLAFSFPSYYYLNCLEVWVLCFSYYDTISEEALADVHAFRPNGFQQAPAQASLIGNGWHPAALEVFTAVRIPPAYTLNTSTSQHGLHIGILNHYRYK